MIFQKLAPGEALDALQAIQRMNDTRTVGDTLLGPASASRGRMP
jgi:hypothetical protein